MLRRTGRANGISHERSPFVVAPSLRNQLRRARQGERRGNFSPPFVVSDFLNVMKKIVSNHPSLRIKLRRARQGERKQPLVEFSVRSSFIYFISALLVPLFFVVLELHLFVLVLKVLLRELNG